VWAIMAFLVAVPVGVFMLQAFMPRLFDQGSAWFTLSNVSQALQGRTFVGLFNSLWVSVTVCALDLVIGGAVAWLSMRTNVGGRHIWPGLMWALLLVPTWLMADGWQDLLEPHGALSEFGLSSPCAYHTLFGPTVTVVIALAVARLLAARRPGRLTKAGDLLLLGSIALPGIVLGAGYIFAFNLPITSRVGLDLYETLPLLIMGYLATSIPTSSRIMIGPAARVHGARAVSAWRSCYVPVVSRVLVLVWLVTLTKTFFELPISQLLYPPGEEPVSVAIDNWIGNYHPAIGAAMTVVALGACFLVIGMVLGGFGLLAPKGWRRLGGWRSVA
jgi:ABC-type Fe3+ transport system permease subunit